VEKARGNEIGTNLAAARAGDQSALAQVLEACRAYLLTFANGELDPNLAAKFGASDLVQVSLFEAQQAFASFGGSSEEELLRWLRRILKHNLVDMTRRYRDTAARAISQEVSLDREAPQAIKRQLADAHHSPLEGLVAFEKKVVLESSLASLPEEFRRVIDLRYSQGRTFVEIGAELGKSEEAARKIWFRAMRKLREELKRHEEFGSSC